MQDELAARPRAVTLRLAGRPIKAICTALGRSEVWFHKWWRRYLQSGPDGLYDRTRANHHVAQHIPPELERAIDSFRREHDLPNRADAILELIRRGLAVAPSADSPKPHGDKLGDAVERATSRPVVMLGEPEDPDER